MDRVDVEIIEHFQETYKHFWKYDLGIAENSQSLLCYLLTYSIEISTSSSIG